MKWSEKNYKTAETSQNVYEKKIEGKEIETVDLVRRREEDQIYKIT